MNHRKTTPFSSYSIFFLALFSLTFLNACNNEGGELKNKEFETTDWKVETHRNDSIPNYKEVFDNDTIKRIDIVISKDRWQSMLDDLTNMYGEFNSKKGQNGPPPAGERPIDGGAKRRSQKEHVSMDNPIYVPADVFYNGKQWYKVGVRFKGNSSLRSSWNNGVMKLPFKLDFDEFENEYPQIKNQNFYGLKKVSLKNNYEDKSMLREKIASDVFEKAGVIAPHTSFCEVFVDFGDGPVYFGVYTMVEEIDNTFLRNQFVSNNGNLYKPSGNASSFVKDSYDEVEYEKKNNKKAVDFTDVEGLLKILHDDSRIKEPAMWRSNLDSIFDTDIFLNYLAINTIIQNWDTYGKMTHNYYLYNNPETNKLTWIPWDNNEALQSGKMGGALNLGFNNMQPSQWPLIEYLYQDEVYKEKYDYYVQNTIENVFTVSSMQALYAKYAEMIEKSATSEVEGFTFLESKSDFQEAITKLNSHVVKRTSAAKEYLK